MYKHKLLGVSPKTSVQATLQRHLLTYHDFRQARFRHPLLHRVAQIEQWQSRRLQHTHQTLYQNARYQNGLDFLLRDLYTPTHFTRRDEDLDRIFPVLIKMVPEQALETVSRLVELNLLTQQLDLDLAQHLEGELEEATYVQAYCACNNFEKRRWQIQLADQIGRELERYVRSRFLSMSLKMTRKAASVAGLAQLHDFLSRGLGAFREMGSVSELLNAVTQEELALLAKIETGSALPYHLPAEPSQEAIR